MRVSQVYLAGPISGCTLQECTDWREDFKASMPDCIECLSPTRGKQVLAGCVDAPAPVITDKYTRDTIAASADPMTALCTDAAIVGRDYFDCTRADVIVFNLLGAKSVSIGTVMEAAWAWAFHKPTVFIMEAEGNLHDHPMIRRTITHRCHTVEVAKLLVRAILDTRNTKG